MKKIKEALTLERYQGKHICGKERWQTTKSSNVVKIKYITTFDLGFGKFGNYHTKVFVTND